MPPTGGMPMQGGPPMQGGMPPTGGMPMQGGPPPMQGGIPQGGLSTGSPVVPIRVGATAPTAVTTVTTVYKTPANQLNFFGHMTNVSDRDYYLIVDKSGSMAGSRWKEAHEAVHVLAPQVCKADPDGICIIFFSGGHHFPKHKNVKDPRHIERLFDHEKPGGTTNLAGALKEAFNDHFHKAKHNRKASTMLVITDGEPDSHHDVEHAIRDATKKMEVANELSVSFIQIGNDHSATKFLEHMDKHVHGAKYDIVDSLTEKEMEGISFVDLIRRSVRD